jgi:hypothetical protein
MVLALATFAALLTLLLPAPAMARPVNLTSGSVAAPGGASSGSVSNHGRRTLRGEHARPGSSLAGSSSIGDVDAWSVAGVSALSAVVPGSSGSGLTLAAAPPSSPLSIISALGLVTSGHDAGAAVAALVGARSSRAPPTL